MYRTYAVRGNSIFSLRLKWCYCVMIHHEHFHLHPLTLTSFVVRLSVTRTTALILLKPSSNGWINGRIRLIKQKQFVYSELYKRQHIIILYCIKYWIVHDSRKTYIKYTNNFQFKSSVDLLKFCLCINYVFNWFFAIFGVQPRCFTIGLIDFDIVDMLGNDFTDIIRSKETEAVVFYTEIRPQTFYAVTFLNRWTLFKLNLYVSCWNDQNFS